MAPEILKEKPYTKAVDWWAFGVLIFELLLGRSPFKGDNEDEIFEAILEEEVVFPASLTSDSISIISKLLVKDPLKRLGSGKGDALDIKKQPYFDGIDWSALLRLEIPPPFLPSVVSPRDTSNFDSDRASERELIW